MHAACVPLLPGSRLHRRFFCLSQRSEIKGLQHPFRAWIGLGRNVLKGVLLDLIERELSAFQQGMVWEDQQSYGEVAEVKDCQVWAFTGGFMQWA